MTNFSEAVMELMKFAGALSVLAGAMTWRRKDSEADDRIAVEAANLVLDALSDGDKVSKIDLHTGKNIREQMTWEEAEELHRERELRGFGIRRN